MEKVLCPMDREPVRCLLDSQGATACFSRSNRLHTFSRLAQTSLGFCVLKKKVCRLMRMLHLSHLTEDFFRGSANPWVVLVGLGPVSSLLLLSRVVVFGWGSTWMWWAILTPIGTTAVHLVFLSVAFAKGLEGLQNRLPPPANRATIASIVFWTLQLMHTVSVLMYSKFAMNPSMAPMHRLGGHISTCFFMAAVVRALKPTACSNRHILGEQQNPCN